MLAIEFYNVVLALHIMAVAFAFGVVLAYPVIVPWMRRTHPATMPTFHALQERLGKLVISPGLGVVVLAGIYLASKGHYWSEVWVSVPLVIAIVLGALGGMFFGPTEKKLSELATRDLGTGGGALGAEYDVVLARWTLVANVGAALVLVAIFFMAAKPFA
jgi:uncharacterized membrane protein